MSPTLQDLLRCLSTVSLADAALPETSLSGAERTALAGHCLAFGPELVRRVASSLRRAEALSPGLFADVAVEPEALLAGLGRADAALRLATVLDDLARRAHDLFLSERGAAVEGAMRVVEQVRRSGELPFTAPAQRRRRGDAFLQVEELLAERQRSRRRVARRNARRREAGKEEKEGKRGTRRSIGRDPGREGP